MLLIRKTLKWTILLGLIGIIPVFVFNLTNTAFREETINGISIYIFDIKIRANNVSIAFDTTPINFQNILPTRQWNDDILNNLALLFDRLYMPLNLILWLLRIIAFLGKAILIVIGYPTNNSVIINSLTFIIENTRIPYI